jgi:hypothetical protein
MKNLNLRILPGAIGRRPRLRADRIRRDTLTQLAAALVEDNDNSVINALHALVDAVKHDATDDEIDTLVGDIEDTARMDDAAVDLTDNDVAQLEFDAATITAPGGTVTNLPARREGEAA